MIPLPNNYFAIEVPEITKQITIKNGSYTKWLVVDGRKWCPINEQGHYRIVALSDEISYDDAAEIVDDTVGGYVDYEDSAKLYDYALDSFRSLLRSLNLGKCVVVNQDKTF